MSIFRCEIQLDSGSYRLASARFEVSRDVRCAIDWLMLAAGKDASSVRSDKCLTVEHLPEEVIIRINRSRTADAAIGQRIS